MRRRLVTDRSVLAEVSVDGFEGIDAYVTVISSWNSAAGELCGCRIIERKLTFSVIA